MSRRYFAEQRPTPGRPSSAGGFRAAALAARRADLPDPPPEPPDLGGPPGFVSLAPEDPPLREEPEPRSLRSPELFAAAAFVSAAITLGSSANGSREAPLVLVGGAAGGLGHGGGAARLRQRQIPPFRWRWVSPKRSPMGSRGPRRRAEPPRITNTIAPSMATPASATNGSMRRSRRSSSRACR